MTQENRTAPTQEKRKVPVPVFQGIPEDANAPEAPKVVRAVSAMAGPVFTAPQG